jgi:hypothetical protein
MLDYTQTFPMFDYTQKDVSYVWLHIQRCSLCLITHRKMLSYVWLHTKRCVLFYYTHKDESYVWLYTERCVICLITHIKMCPMLDYKHKDVSYV